MRGLTQKGILLHADPPYQMKDEKTGEITAEGMKCIWLPDESLEHYEKEVRGRRILGIKPYPITLTLKCAEKLVAVPGMYNFKMEYTDIKQTKEFNGEKTTNVVQGITPVSIEGYVGEIKLNVQAPKP